MNHIQGTLLHVQIPKLEVKCLTPARSIWKKKLNQNRKPNTILYKVKRSHFSVLLSDGFITYFINGMGCGRQLLKNNRKKIKKIYILRATICLRIDLPGNYSGKMVSIQKSAAHQICKIYQ